jgi:hypothetical protein
MRNKHQFFFNSKNEKLFKLYRKRRTNILARHEKGFPNWKLGRSFSCSFGLSFLNSETTDKH